MSWRGPVYRDPRAVVLFGVIAVSSVGTALGAVPLPGSLRLVPDLYGQTAAIALFAGSVLAVTGILWRNRMDGLVVEQLGHVIAGVGAALYAIALFTAAAGAPLPEAQRMTLFGVLLPLSSDAVLAFGMSLAITGAGVVQWWRILRFRRRLKQQALSVADLLEPPR